MVNQSEIIKLLDVIEHIKSGESTEGNDSPKIGTEIETNKFQSDTSTFADESCTNTGEISQEETNELFKLCQEIQNIVREDEPNSVTIPDISDCTSVDDKGVVEKIFIDVEEEKVYNENNNSQVKNASELCDVIDITDIMDQVDDSTLELNTTKLQSDTNTSSDIELDYYTEESFNNDTDNALFKSKDLLYEFDSILNSYESLDVLLNDPDSSNLSEQSSPSLSSVGDDDFGDMLSELFPSLSSLY